MSASLLVVDGDSFAHRAFHALPRSIRRADGSPGNLLTGLVSMLLRLWEAERPRAVFVGWDTLFVPTYRHEQLPGYQAGREFDPELLELHGHRGCPARGRVGGRGGFVAIDRHGRPGSQVS